MQILALERIAITDGDATQEVWKTGNLYYLRISIPGRDVKWLRLKPGMTDAGEDLEIRRGVILNTSNK